MIANSMIEGLESRTLLSGVESASAQLQLLSTAGTTTSPVYNYGITLKNTGTSNLGTFWFGWIPGEDFLPSIPTSPTSPAGWGNAAGTSSTPAVTGRMNAFDGSAIQWVAQSAGAALTPGNSLAGFDFSTTDSPLVLNGNSPQHPPTPVLTSFVYVGAPLSDSGFNFVVTGIAGVSAAPSQTKVAASAPSITAGNSVTLTATVMPASPGITPTGTVTFAQGGASLGSALVQPDGTAALSTSALPVGADSITATYDGDANYTASVSPAIIETVTAAPLASTTTLFSLAPIVTTGNALTFTAIIKPASGNGPTPSGTVTFFDGGATIGVIAVSNDGIAVINEMSLSIGIHSISATYSGDSNYLSSSAAAIPENILAPAMNPPTLAPSIVRSTLPRPIILTATTHAIVSVKVVNRTAATIKGKSTLDLYLATDGVLNDFAFDIGSLTRNLNLKPNKTVVVPVKVNSNVSLLSVGTYTLFVQTVDPSNNVTNSAAGPTVQIVDPFVSLSESFARMALPASVAADAKTHGVASVRISNGGNVEAFGATTISIYASTDGLVDGTATVILSKPKMLRLKPGKSITLSLPIKMFPAVAAGSYSIIAQVIDPERQTTSTIAAMKVSVS